MSIKLQTQKNMDLTEKLMDFFISASNLPKMPKDVSFVPFSKKDEELNKANEKLLELLYKEGKPVAKAQEPKTSKGKWVITPINF